MITLVTEIAGAAYITRLIMALVDRLERPRKEKSPCQGCRSDKGRRKAHKTVRAPGLNTL